MLHIFRQIANCDGKSLRTLTLILTCLRWGEQKCERAIESRVQAAYKTINLSDEMRDRIDTDEDIKVMMQEVLEELHPRKTH